MCFGGGSSSAPAAAPQPPAPAAPVPNVQETDAPNTTPIAPAADTTTPKSTADITQQGAGTNLPSM